MRAKKVSHLLVILTFSFSFNSLGQTLNLFDTNNDGVLSIVELQKYFFKTYKKELFNADTNHDLTISNAEFVQQIDAFILNLQVKFGNKVSFTFDEVNQLFPVKQKFTAGGFLVRETLEDISPSTSAKDISKIKAAIFSYTRDFTTKASTWIANGAIMRPIDTKKGYFIVPSIVFNRVISKDSTKSANSLVPKVGFYFQSKTPSSHVFDAHLFRILANYATDFDFKSSQIGIEAEWEPVFKNVPGLGVYYLIKSSWPIEYRLQAFLHAESGHVFSKGEKENLESNSTYVRTGGKIGIDFRFFESIGLSSSVRYLYGFAGVPRNNRYYTATAEYTIGPVGNIGLKVEYQKGNVPLTSEEIENVVVGLGVKF